jgi:hypothetical protein
MRLPINKKINGSKNKGKWSRKTTPRIGSTNVHKVDIIIPKLVLMLVQTYLTLVKDLCQWMLHNVLTKVVHSRLMTVCSITHFTLNNHAIIRNLVANHILIRFWNIKIGFVMTKDFEWYMVVLYAISNGFLLFTIHLFLQSFSSRFKQWVTQPLK